VATRDQWGRDLGVDLSVSEMAREMNSPTTNRVETSSAPSPSDKSWNKIYEAVKKYKFKDLDKWNKMQNNYTSSLPPGVYAIKCLINGKMYILD
jgi:hypothetical protein